MGIFSDTSETQTSASSTLALTAAGDALRRYMRLASNNDIVDAVGGGDSDSIKIAIQSDPAEVEYRNSIKDIIHQLNTPDSPTSGNVTATAGKIKDDAADNISSATASSKNPAVIDITPEEFGTLNDIRSGAKESNGNTLSTSITHYAITNSGKDFNFSDRGSDYVAMFCSLIPSVELSLCVPHFKISFTQVETQQTSDYIPFLKLESFLGAGQENASAIGSATQKSLPSAHNSSEVNSTNQRIGTSTSGMELFLSPQTLVNADINTTSLYQTTRNVTVLDPLQPLMSIESIGIDVNAIGKNFMTTNMTVNLTLILHDRSRLTEIAPLISPSLRPTIRTEIEYGWNHPDTNEFTNNPYSKFLNALKVKQIFSVTQATLSSRDATSLSIKVTLVGLGNSTANDLSAFTGEYIEYAQAEAKLKQVFRIIETNSNSGTPDAPQTTSQIHIGDEIIVKTSEYAASDRWIKYSDYVAITDITRDLDPAKINDLINIYKKIITETTSQTNPNKTAIITLIRNRVIADLSAASWESSAYYNKVISSQDERNYFGKNIISYILADEGSSDAGFLTFEDKLSTTGSPSATGFSGLRFGKAPSKIVLLGDVIYRLFSIPIGLGRFYDEIRVTTFDFNDYAGAMGGLNIGSLPISQTRLADTLKMSTSATCMSIIQGLLETASDPAYAPFGIKAAIANKAAMEAKIGDNEDQTNAETPTIEQAQAEFERTITAIYNAKSAIKSVSYEPKFVAPQIKLETVVMPINAVNADGTSTVKHVLCIFIYDGANSGKSETNLIVSAMKKSSGVVKVIDSTSSIQSNSDLFKIKKQSDGTYDVSVNKAQAKSIISAAYPTIKIGAEGSTIINASYSTMSSGVVENALQYKSLAESYSGASGTATSADVNANFYLTPSSVSISMLGMPLLNRGQNYYIDFGTGTSLDNVYTVTTVKHSIKGGQFTTTATLLPTNAASIRSILTQIRSDLGIVEQHAENTTPSTTTVMGRQARKDFEAME